MMLMTCWIIIIFSTLLDPFAAKLSWLELKKIKLSNFYISNNIYIIIFQDKMKTIFSFPTHSLGVLLQLGWLNFDWSFILKRTQLNLNLLEPFIAFRKILLRILNCKDCTMQYLLQSASTLRKVGIFNYKMYVFNVEGLIDSNILLIFRALDSL